MKASLKRRLVNCHYEIYSFLNRIVPKKKNYIFIYDAPFMRQNGWAFYRYLMETGYSSKYKIFFYCEKYNDHYGRILNSGVIKNPIIGWFIHLVSKYTFYEYHNFKYCCKPGNRQISVYLTHGMPVKNYGYLLDKPDHPYEDDYTYLLVTSDYYLKLMKRCLGCADSQVYLGGMPRCDQLFSSVDISWIKGDKKEVILWMPTIRTSTENGIKDSKNDIPLVNSENIDEVNSILEENNICLILKLHPLQNRIAWLHNKEYSCIRILRNADLDFHKIELYELMGSVDVLLTDYSSVFSDFLLTEKPIAFAFDDLEEYKQNRGLLDGELLNHLPGPLIESFAELISFIKKHDYVDQEYRNRRTELQKMLSPKPIKNTYSEDLCSFLGLTK